MGQRACLLVLKRLGIKFFQMSKLLEGYGKIYAEQSNKHKI